MELLKASHQWATRPSDERFTSLTELDTHCRTIRDRSAARVLPSRAISCQPLQEDSRALVCVGPNGAPVNITHWSFGQIAQRAGAPAGYLRDIPAPLAADCINYGLAARDQADIGLLLHKPLAGTAQLRAVTGPTYGRIWNATITEALIKRFGDGITGDFRVPGEFGKRVEVTKENTTLYASDRDMFVFLADETHRIEIPNRRNGETGTMARGFFVWNSEVGAGTLGIATFGFDYVCCNRIVWGARNYQEIKIRHTSGAPERWIDEVVPAIQDYANASTAGIENLIESAQARKIGDTDEVIRFLAQRFSRSQSTAIMAAHMNDEGRPIETLWDAATGITGYARGVAYQDQRVDLEREAGKVLDLAA